MHVFNGTVPMSDLRPAGPKKSTQTKKQTNWQMMKKYIAWFPKFDQYSHSFSIISSVTHSKTKAMVLLSLLLVKGRCWIKPESVHLSVLA